MVEITYICNPSPPRHSEASGGLTPWMPTVQMGRSGVFNTLKDIFNTLKDYFLHVENSTTSLPAATLLLDSTRPHNNTDS